MKRLGATLTLASGIVVLTAGIAFAWPHTVTAAATCDEDTNHVLVTATFTNTSEAETEIVTALGQTFTTHPGDTVTFGPADIGEAPQPAGTVTVTDAHQNTDSAEYPAVEPCRETPTPTPTHSPTCHDSNTCHHRHNYPPAPSNGGSYHAPQETAFTGGPDLTLPIVAMIALVLIGAGLMRAASRERG